VSWLAPRTTTHCCSRWRLNPRRWPLALVPGKPDRPVAGSAVGYRPRDKLIGVGNASPRGTIVPVTTTASSGLCAQLEARISTRFLPSATVTDWLLPGIPDPTYVDRVRPRRNVRDAVHAICISRPAPRVPSSHTLAAGIACPVFASVTRPVTLPVCVESPSAMARTSTAFPLRDTNASSPVPRARPRALPEPSSHRRGPTLVRRSGARRPRRQCGSRSVARSSRSACFTLAPSRFRAIARRSGATVLVRAGSRSRRA